MKDAEINVLRKRVLALQVWPAMNTKIVVLVHGFWFWTHYDNKRDIPLSDMILSDPCAEILSCILFPDVMCDYLNWTLRCGLALVLFWVYSRLPFTVNGYVLE